VAPVPPPTHAKPLMHDAVVVTVVLSVAWLLLPEMSVHWVPLMELAV
jgi:hypothetical protein